MRKLIVWNMVTLDGFRKAGQVDEYRIGLNPLLLGEGTPMFKASKDRTRLALLEARAMQSGVVLLRYAQTRGAHP